MEVLGRYSAVALGGALGAVTRYSLNLLFAKVFAPFPFATFFINVTGSFLIGFLTSLFAEKFTADETLRLFFITGFLGAYTTFSTFELESLELIRGNRLPTAIFYVSASFAVGLIAAATGIWTREKFL